MAGFVRRFTEFPPLEALTAIEGVNIIDLPPPGSIVGVSSGVMCVVGEFTDMTYAVAVDVAGVVTTKPRPVEIFTGQDLINKLGGFDSSLGQFGGDMGNGFVELRNKRFSRLVAVPVNLASGAGVRLWRELPTNKSATDPTPVVAIRAAQVDAGRLFGAGADRLRIATRAGFSDLPAVVQGVDGATTGAGFGLTQTITSAGSSFITAGVLEGDTLVLGVVGAAGALGTNADTYRIVSFTATTLVVQKQDGSSFEVATGTLQPFRVHPASVADTGLDHQLSEAAGYLVPARPTTDGAGTGSSAANGTWTANTTITPTVVPPIITADSADPLSGLQGKIHPTTAFIYTALVQKPNAPNDSLIDALYDTAVDSLLQDDSPAREVNHVWSARKSNAIRTKLKSHVLEASSIGIGRTASASPELDIVLATSLATVTGDTAPGVGATREERVDYSWPGVLTFIPEAAGVVIATADGKTTTTGILDLTSDGWLSSIMSNIAPERNPGEGSSTVRRVMAPVLGFARNTPDLSINEYISLRQKGIAAPRMDRVVGPIFQSGITSSLVSGQKNINRRRMADFIEDSWAQRMAPLAKLLLTEQLKDTILTETEEFMAGLLSAENPAAQRISGYIVDGVSGNTPSLEAAGVFVVILRVRTLATADFITLQAEIGEGVVITEVAA
jgi:hypothetical protein